MGIRVGVVGCGYWGSKHVRVMHELEGVDSLVAIDQSTERLSALARSFPRLETFESLDDAMDSVDAVVIATPPRSHTPVGLLAISQGKHVLIEKPLATSAADAERLIDAAEQADVALMVGHTFEYNPAVWKLREHITSGSLGRPYYIDTARLNLGLYQSDVNVVWDLAPHDVSIANYILGEQPATVHAWGSKHAHQEYEDVAYLRLLYPGGVTVQVHVSWLDPCKVRRVTVVGSEKMAVYNDMNDEERLRIFDKSVVPGDNGDALHRVPPTYRYGGVSSPYINFQEPLRVQDRHFLDCIGFGERPSTDGQNGLAVVRVLEAADESMRQGRPIQLATNSAP